VLAEERHMRRRADDRAARPDQVGDADGDVGQRRGLVRRAHDDLERLGLAPRRGEVGVERRLARGGASVGRIRARAGAVQATVLAAAAGAAAAASAAAKATPPTTTPRADQTALFNTPDSL
jgi:hypothetical protein